MLERPPYHQLILRLANNFEFISCIYFYCLVGNPSPITKGSRYAESAVQAIVLLFREMKCFVPHLPPHGFRPSNVSADSAILPVNCSGLVIFMETEILFSTAFELSAPFRNPYLYNSYG